MKNDYLSFLLALFLPFSFFAQTATPAQIPALEQQLLSSTDSLEKARICNELAYAYLRTNYVKAEIFANRALVLAQLTGDKTEEIKALIQQSEGFIKKNEWARVRQLLEQALESAEKASDKSMEALCLHKMGRLQQTLGELDKALYYYEKSLALREYLGDQVGLGASYTNIGGVYQFKGEYERALEFGRKAIAMRRVLNDRAGLVFSLNAAGETLLLQGKFDEMLPIAQEASEIAESLGDKRGFWRSLNIWGTGLKEKGEYGAALPILEKAHRTARDLGDENSRLFVQGNLAAVLERLNRMEEAADYYLEIIEKAEQNPNFPNRVFSISASCIGLGNIYDALDRPEAKAMYEKGLSLDPPLGLKIEAYNNLGFHYKNRLRNPKQHLYYARMAYDLRKYGNGIMPILVTGNYGMALVTNDSTAKGMGLMKTALKMMEASNTTYKIANLYTEISAAVVQLNKKDIAEALKVAQKALALAEQSGSLSENKIAHERLSALFDSLGQKDKALFHLSRADFFEDSIYRSSAVAHIAKAEARQEFSQVLYESKQNIASQQTEIAQQQQKNTYLGLSLFGLLAATGLGYWLFRRRQRLRDSLRDSEMRRQIAESELKLLLERQRISRDLHDSVGSTISSIRFLSEATLRGVQQDLEKKRLGSIGDKAREAMESISDIVWAINPENDSMEIVLQRMAQYASETLEAAGIDLHFKNDPGLSVLSLPMAQRKDLYLIFKEAVNNAAKHSRATEAWVDIFAANGSLHLRVRDNGMGFSGEKTGSNGGNGLKNMAARAAALGGVFLVEKPAEGGNCVALTMPILPPHA